MSVLASNALRGALLVAALALPAPAAAMGRVVGAHATQSAVDVALAQGPDGVTVTTALEVDARGGPVAVLLPVEGLVAGSAAVAPSFAALDALVGATDPRLGVLEAKEPCANFEALYPADPSPVPLPRPARVAPPGPWTLVTVDGDWAAFEAAHHVTVDASTRAALKARAPGGQVLALVGRLPAGRGQWLGPVTWRQPSPPKTLPLTLGLDQVTPGRLLAARVFTAHPEQEWAVVGAPAVDLPGGIHLPEVALETPQDLARAAVQNALQRAGRGAVLRGFSGAGPEIPGATPGAVVARYELRLGSRDGDRQVHLQPQIFKARHEPRWTFRRVWREPISCPIAPRYQRIVQIQQQSEVAAYIGLTGRPRQEILRQSAERGYAQRPDGRLDRVKPKRR